LKIFHSERKNCKADFTSFIATNKKPVIWVHVASLGEYEQAVPVLEKLKPHITNYSILITFFSDSGYKVKKDSHLADHVTYLSLDTPSNAKRFIELVKPSFAIFVKYDIWPNYMRQLSKKGISCYLISARLRKDQIYFKRYGGFFRKALMSFNQIFVQNIATGHYLNEIAYTSWILTGDTRYDRVSQQLLQDNKLSFMEDFVTDKMCFVAGSTWDEGHKMISEVINTSGFNLKYVIVPHQIHEADLSRLQNYINRPSIRYTQIENKDLSKYDVLIIDSVGMLTKIYAYADIAYVGGGLGKKGLHNILEPAVFGVPVIIGTIYDKFPEARELRGRRGLKVVANAAQLQDFLNDILNDKKLYKSMSKASEQFVKIKKGATEKISKYIIEDQRLLK
jgi:3-deoxy-D-manno-octulosonic-acid transferase